MRVCVGSLQAMPQEVYQFNNKGVILCTEKGIDLMGLRMEGEQTGGGVCWVSLLPSRVLGEPHSLLLPGALPE